MRPTRRPSSELRFGIRAASRIAFAVGLTGNLTFATLVPVQELHFHVAVRIELAGVNQVGDWEGLLS